MDMYRTKLICTSDAVNTFGTGWKLGNVPRNMNKIKSFFVSKVGKRNKLCRSADILRLNKCNAKIYIYKTQSRY